MDSSDTSFVHVVLDAVLDIDVATGEANGARVRTLDDRGFRENKLPIRR